MIVARHEVPGVMKKNAPSQRDGDSLHRYPRHLYVFSATSQSCSSFVLVRFSGDPNEPSAACFLRSSLFILAIAQPRTRTRTIGPLSTYRHFVPGYDHQNTSEFHPRGRAAIRDTRSVKSPMA
jgi:hypothetical protein